MQRPLSHQSGRSCVSLMPWRAGIALILPTWARQAYGTPSIQYVYGHSKQGACTSLPVAAFLQIWTGSRACWLSHVAVIVPNPVTEHSPSAAAWLFDEVLDGGLLCGRGLGWSLAFARGLRTSYVAPVATSRCPAC